MADAINKVPLVVVIFTGSLNVFPLAPKLSLGVHIELMCHILYMDSQIQFGNQKKSFMMIVLSFLN